MKEIGERFEEARENIGISREEAASDLKVEPDQIMHIEMGNIKAFDNVVSLKYLIRDYSKYLGLDAEEMLDEYNEYLFDCTSKISLEDIKAAKQRLARQAEGTLEKQLKSPYTKVGKKKPVFAWLISIVGILLIAGIIWAIFFMPEKKPTTEDDIITYIE